PVLLGIGAARVVTIDAGREGAEGRGSAGGVGQVIDRDDIQARTGRALDVQDAADVLDAVGGAAHVHSAEVGENALVQDAQAKAAGAGVGPAADVLGGLDVVRVGAEPTLDGDRIDHPDAGRGEVLVHVLGRDGVAVVAQLDRQAVGRVG